MRRHLMALVAAVLLFSFLSGKELRLNEIQIIGTHNSYHLRPEKEVLMQPRGAALDYGHAPLKEQLEAGVRSFAIDIVQSNPGFRVLHIPGIDEHSNCANLKECLGELISWSDRHPGHIPLIVFIEMKNLKEPQGDLVPMRAKDLEQLEDLIWMSVGKEKLLTPDAVRGSFPSLEKAVLHQGWPLLDEVRGKFLIQLNGPEDLLRQYASGEPALAGRAMFIKAEPGNPEAALVVSNDPSDPIVTELARKGYLVRTRADSGVKEPAANDTSRRDAAFQSAAQIVTTDFPAPTPHPKTGYVVRFPKDEAWRINPVLVP